MNDSLENAVAIVGVGAILPDAPDADAFWHNVTRGVYSVSEVDPARWDPGALLRPGPEGAGEDLLHDRRLGARLGLEPARLEAADPAEGGRRHGRRPQVGGRVHADGADGRRLAGAPARSRPHRGDHRQRPRRRAALPDHAADHVPRARARARGHRELRRASRRRRARRSSTSSMRGSTTGSPV